MENTKQRIVGLLNKNGGLTTGELSEILGISATAVRRHLNTLKAEDVVCHITEQRGVGRPSYVYQLTDSPPAVFSQSYSAFVASVLEELTGLDGEKKLHDLFQQHHQKRRQKYVSLTKGETLLDRVASLARLMEYEGRMTTWQQLNENQFILREHNCPLYRLADEFDYPCHCEVDLLKQTLKAKVRRVNHIREGDVACAYDIQGRDSGDAGLASRSWSLQPPQSAGRTHDLTVTD